MFYVIDSANVDAIRRCNEFFPLSGVTTNPSIIAKEKTDFLPRLKEIRSIIGNEKMLHVQTTAKTADKIVEEARLLKDILGGSFYVKIPISAEGIKATKMLSKEGIGVTETAIFSPQQALMAAEAGADFVAPYVNRLDNILADGVAVVSEIVTLFELYGLETKVLAASFKNVEQIHKTLLTGADAITIAPELFDQLIFHPLTNTAIDGFDRDWTSVYGEKKIPDLL